VSEEADAVAEVVATSGGNCKTTVGDKGDGEVGPPEPEPEAVPVNATADGNADGDANGEVESDVDTDEEDEADEVEADVECVTADGDEAGGEDRDGRLADSGG